MRNAALFLLIPVLAATSMAGESPPESETPTPILETVLVSGEQPGPGLWRVSKDDHELWILGTLSPLPRRMRWQSDKLERLVAGSQEILAVPQATLRADVGFFGSLGMIGPALRARNNPEGEKLSEVVPPETYRRWSVQKRKYLPRDRAVEKRRPLLAASELYEQALADNGLSESDRVWPVLKKAAKKHKVNITMPSLEIVIEQPKRTLKELSGIGLDDTQCLELTLQRLETDLDNMKARANAWATGDVLTLAELPYPDQDRACTQAVLESAIAERQGLTDLPGRLRGLWLEAAESALANNRRSLAVLPIRVLLQPDGLLATLRERGYSVQAP